MVRRAPLAALFLFCALVAALALGCKPKPPQITVKSGQITRVDAQGFEVVLHIDAYNPNSYALSVRGVDADVLVDGRLDLGKVTIARPLSIPPAQRVPIDVPVASRWTDLVAMGTIAASNRSVPYTVKGTVTVGGETLNVDVPYAFDGVITHEQMVKAAVGSIPRIPGLELP